ncbi:hypothetical protein EVJ58_g4713 [Rhodofomes roseus]|uniref:GH18 domain-containing protein n=1 Tax=Rhodofomes roseus TaxID=34475 RepID=A0A4Y9YGH6_9APHY|nr:hypothetical protein EVJ58_g4713 [Rhodofomes roseus]
MYNCNPVPPTGGGNDIFGGGATHRRIGYYEGWASSSSSRPCDVYQPEQIAAEVLTHGQCRTYLIDRSLTLTEMSPGDIDLWARTTLLKKRNSALKVFLSVGGWSFNDPPTSTIFSQLVASAENTNTFISSALEIMEAFGFDGLDIDWEYPAAYDRGGNPADKDNYVTFMRELKTAFGDRLSEHRNRYLQHFNVTGLLQWADFVNVMTYDLHGVWDGKDPYIGYIVLAHTNLTEIKNTLQLLQNVEVDWSQVNIGFGFYGRTFELTSEECTTPECPFVGPADAGPCTHNAGTLSWAEIQGIISSNDLQPVLDEDAAVKYVVWDDRQWVSYDDDETFRLKLDYLNAIVGGSFIWSVDQDDAQYTALTALYPDININNASSTQTNQCKYTGCGESCPPDYTPMTTVTTPPTGLHCTKKARASLCCPTAAWLNEGPMQPGTTCHGQCNVGEITLALDPAGQQAYCCSSGSSAPLECYASACGETLSECPSGYSGLTFVKQGSTDDGYCEEEHDDSNIRVKHTCPTVCSSNDKPVCCASESSYNSCHWVGTPPACTDATCAVGEVSVFQDIQGDASSTCKGKARRNYCCTPPTSEEFLPVPEDWVIPLGEGYGADQPASFTADFDDNTGPSDPTGEGTGTTGIGDDGQENDSPFGEVFITSPNAQSVSSLDVQSDWVLVGCDSQSDQPQSILAYCSMVRMPSTCGAGPYARVVSLQAHDDQSALPAEHQTVLPLNEKVYVLSFDYQFDVIPEENGPVYMRADITDIPGYWDEMIDSAPDNSPTDRKRDVHYKRNFHQPVEYEKRWFGGFTEWLQRLNTITNGNSISRNFHWSDTYTIYHAEESCPNFQSSLDISVSGNAQINSQFGYYLEATVVPPAIQQAYIYVNAGASASAMFTMTGLAKAEWSSDQYELISFGFPGLYYPGLLTLGPSLHLYGQLSGEVSLYGQLSTSVGYSFPVHQEKGDFTDGF